MRDLEHEFAVAAAEEGNVYLPNFTPAGKVDALLIAMEPSMSWAPTPAEAHRRIAAGLRNFMWSAEAMIVHWAAKRFLCSSGETYHITDISKGAMLTATANADRSARYARWAPLLKEEIELVAKPDAQVIALGATVGGFLKRSGLVRDFRRIIHYSPLAGAARNAAVLGREVDFGAFSLSMDELIDVATEVMRENAVPDPMQVTTINLLREYKLTPSLKKLAFVYSTAFESWQRAHRQRDAVADANPR
ncbi:MAG: hypothetical protein QM736_16640 [Vicinamibacterales bacterium]